MVTSEIRKKIHARFVIIIIVKTQWKLFPNVRSIPICLHFYIIGDKLCSQS